MSTYDAPSNAGAAIPDEPRPAKPPVVRDETTRRASTVWGLLVRLRAFVFLLVVVAYFSTRVDVYLDLQNLTIMSKHAAQLAILALGMLMVIIPGGIDLSVGSVVGLVGMLVGGLINEGLAVPIFDSVVFFSIPVVVLLGLVIGSSIGVLNGLIVTRLRVAPFIATLGVLFIARGFALLRSNGATFSNLGGDSALGNTGFRALGTTKWLSLPLVIWIMAGFAIAVWVLLNRTAFGRHVYAVGGNERAAELAGVNVRGIKVATYAFAGLTAATIGMIVSSELNAAHPATGELFELNAIAAVVLGGASLMGGRGTVQGTIIGAFVIAFLGDGLVLDGVPSFWQQIIKGAVIIAAVAFDELQNRLGAGRRRLRQVKQPARSLTHDAQEEEEMRGERHTI